MDEIHIKSDFSYTGGKIIGSSVNTELMPATTVLAYKVQVFVKNGSPLFAYYLVQEHQLLNYSPLPNK